MPEARKAAPLGEMTASILAWLAQHGPATALEVGRALDLEGTSMRGRLTMLARQGLVAGGLNGAVPPQRTYIVSEEGRRRAGISDTR